MSRDYGEKERQFLEALKEDTGRGLNEWMAAIADEKLASRNDIIDWLRRQGFMFSKASWLERIHNNGGRPLYESSRGERQTARARSEAHGTAAEPAAEIPSPQDVAVPPAAARQPAKPPVPPRAAPPAPAPAPAPVAAPPLPAAPALDLEQVLAKAKAFRPLANFVLGEIAKAVPGVRLVPQSSFVLMMGANVPFAVLTISARELRLGLSLAGSTIEPPFAAARLPSVPASLAVHFTHMAILTDARQINDALIAKVRETAQAIG